MAGTLSGGEPILINLVDESIPSRLDYRKVSPKQKSEGSNYISQLSSNTPGVFQAEGRGLGLTVGDTLYMSLKGSQSLLLPLQIVTLDYLIEPNDQWRATLKGDAFENISIFTWSVQCNGCPTAMPLEFVTRAQEGQAQQVFHAESRLKTLGWRVDGGHHYCPECVD